MVPLQRGQYSISGCLFGVESSGCGSSGRYIKVPPEPCEEKFAPPSSHDAGLSSTRDIVDLPMYLKVWDTQLDTLGKEAPTPS